MVRALDRNTEAVRRNTEVLELVTTMLEGFNATPPPSDWEERIPGSQPSTPAKPVVNRYERTYGSGTPMTSSTGAPLPPPPRTIGSKIPINRRHKRRR